MPPAASGTQYSIPTKNRVSNKDRGTWRETGKAGNIDMEEEKRGNWQDVPLRQWEEEEEASLLTSFQNWKVARCIG